DGAKRRIGRSASCRGTLAGGAAAGPTNIRAGGPLGSPGPGLIEHFDGHTWAATNLPFNGWLRSVTAVAPNNVWAVGLRWAANNAESPLTMHFNGHVWAVVANPRLLPGRNDDQAWLVSVSGAAANVWAVG